MRLEGEESENETIDGSGLGNKTIEEDRSGGG